MNGQCNLPQKSALHKRTKLWRTATAMGAPLVVAAIILSAAWGQEKTLVPSGPGRGIAGNKGVLRQSSPKSNNELQLERLPPPYKPVADGFTVIYSNESQLRTGQNARRINLPGQGLIVSTGSPFEKEFLIDVPDEAQLQRGAAYLLLNVRAANNREPANGFSIRFNDSPMGTVGLNVNQHPYNPWESHIVVIDPKLMKKGRNKLTLYEETFDTRSPIVRHFEMKSVIFHYHAG